MNSCWQHSRSALRLIDQERALATHEWLGVVTKDGVTVAREIELEDPFENIGARMVREVAAKTNRPVYMRQGIDKAASDVVEQLRTLAARRKQSMQPRQRLMKASFPAVALHYCVLRKPSSQSCRNRKKRKNAWATADNTTWMSLSCTH